MNPLLLLLPIGWLVGAGITVALNKPQDATDGVIVIACALIGWPLLALGWLVSRPWA